MTTLPGNGNDLSRMLAATSITQGSRVIKDKERPCFITVIEDAKHSPIPGAYLAPFVGAVTTKKQRNLHRRVSPSSVASLRRFA